MVKMKGFKWASKDFDCYFHYNSMYFHYNSFALAKLLTDTRVRVAQGAAHAQQPPTLL